MGVDMSELTLKNIKSEIRRKKNVETTPPLFDYIFIIWILPSYYSFNIFPFFLFKLINIRIERCEKQEGNFNKDQLLHPICPPHLFIQFSHQFSYKISIHFKILFLLKKKNVMTVLLSEPERV